MGSARDRAPQNWRIGMETSLHRALKTHYAAGTDQIEVRLGGFRIDAVVDQRLIEIQHGSLAAIRDKIRKLLETHDVLVVKPIVARKVLVKPHATGTAARRLSPKRGTLFDLFDELIYFTRVFPHPRLTLEAVLVEVEEWRVPGHGRRRRWRRNDHVVADQHLTNILETRQLATAADLWGLLPPDMPRPFHTGDMAERLDVPRHVAQRIAYCMRHCGAIEQVGKRRGAWLYEPLVAKKPKVRRKRKAA
jgi:hypothetical protein